MDDEKDLGLDGESELEARDFESDMNMKSMEEDYGPTYNLSAVVLICISKPTQRHPLVVVCAVAEAVGFYIERAIIGEPTCQMRPRHSPVPCPARRRLENMPFIQRVRMHVCVCVHYDGSSRPFLVMTRGDVPR